MPVPPAIERHLNGEFRYGTVKACLLAPLACVAYVIVPCCMVLIQRRRLLHMTREEYVCDWDLISFLILLGVLCWNISVLRVWKPETWILPDLRNSVLSSYGDIREPIYDSNPLQYAKPRYPRHVWGTTSMLHNWFVFISSIVPWILPREYMQIKLLRMSSKFVSKRITVLPTYHPQ
jgi:hypothetical protein